MVDVWEQLEESGATVSHARGERFLLRDRTLRHATVTRVHMKGGEFDGVNFAHTRFVDCYFTPCDVPALRLHGGLLQGL